MGDISGTFGNISVAILGGTSGNPGTWPVRLAEAVSSAVAGAVIGITGSSVLGRLCTLDGFGGKGGFSLAPCVSAFKELILIGSSSFSWPITGGLMKVGFNGVLIKKGDCTDVIAYRCRARVPHLGITEI